MGVKKIIFLSILAVSCQWLAAQDRSCLRVKVSTGWQQENLHWSIAGNSAGQNPNVYSELKWRQVSGSLLRVSLEGDAWKRWCWFADGSRVFTRSGRVTDTDYGLDNRNDVLYKETFDSHEGYAYSCSVGLGYRLLDKPLFQLTPYIGYGLDGQSFSILDPGGAVAFLNSHYTTQWKGPLVKVAGSGRLVRRWEWEAMVMYHQVDYSAVADWNLITTFSHPVSFRHTAEGYGVDAGVSLRYAVSRRIVVQAGAAYFNWQTGTGGDALYLSSGETDKTQLNGVGRDGWKGEAGISWAWY